MTADQAVLAVVIPAVFVLAILAVPAWRKRRARTRRVVAAFLGLAEANRETSAALAALIGAELAAKREAGHD